MWIQAALFVAAAVVALAVWTRKDVAAPGPREYPLLQGLPFLLRHKATLLESLLAFTRQFRGTWTVKWPFAPRYFFVTDPSIVEHVLKTNFDNYVKGPLMHANLEDLLGDGIFNADGAKWQVQRKLAAHMFSRREFTDTIMTTFHAHGAELEAVLAAAAASGQPLDMQSLFHRFTLDTIGDIAFGHTVGAMADASVPFAVAFDRAQAIVERRFFTPGWQLAERLDGTSAALAAAVATMDAYSAALIAARRTAGDYASRRDLLSRFMAVTDEAGGAPYLHDDKFLRDIVLSMMIAGRDTTAQALSWAVHRICGRPDVQDKLAAEAAAVLGAGAAAVPLGDISYDTLQRGLRYTTAVVQETLRLHPSVPKDVKQALADDTLPDGTRVPAGAFVAYLPWVMGRLESNWGPTAEAFEPERFMGDTRHSQYKYIAFNGGYRTCLGQGMALAEAAFVLGLIFRRWRLEAVPGQAITYADALTLPQKVGIRVTVHARA